MRDEIKQAILSRRKLKVTCFYQDGVSAMENSEVIEKLVDIYEQVNELKEKPDQDSIQMLISYFCNSRKLILEYNSRNRNALDRVTCAYLKMVKAEELAQDYATLHEEMMGIYDIDVIFETYREAYEAFFWDKR